MRTFHHPYDLHSAVGSKLGVSEWVELNQDVIDSFAGATGDHQWIHVDVSRASEGPFGGTIAHGLLTLSLLPTFWQQVYEVDQVGMALNYGFNKVRFMSPVPSGSRVRADVHLVEVERIEESVQAVLSTTVEIEGVNKPALVAESVARYIPEPEAVVQ